MFLSSEKKHKTHFGGGRRNKEDNKSQKEEENKPRIRYIYTLLHNVIFCQFWKVPKEAMIHMNLEVNLAIT